MLLLAINPIRSYDYFWHLATGRWIVEHGAVPLTDPFTVGSDRVPWINGAWLADVFGYAIHQVAGHAGVSFFRALAVALLFTALAARLARRVPLALAFAATLICFAGASHRLGARPETIGIVCAVAAAWLALRRPDARNLVAYGIVSVAWANLHQSALLAPIFAIVAAIATWRDDDADRRYSMIRAGIAAAALAVTPYGLETLLAPLRLAGQVGDGTFVNREWLPSNPLQFPLLYAAIAAVALLMFRSPERNLTRIVLTLILAALAVRYVRNHGFFFALLPLLVADDLAALFGRRETSSAERTAVQIALIVAAVSIPILRPLTLLPDPRIFPLHTAGRIATTPVKGNIYNADQFGGVLIWELYPQRRVLTDGRNELYRTLLPEIERGKRDGRAWVQLQRKYRIVAALEEYRDQPLQIIDGITGRARFGTPSLAYFPRRQWALIAFDDVGMLFVRRDRVPPAFLARYEYRQLRPDLADLSDVTDTRLFRRELARALREEDAPRRLNALLGYVRRGL